MNIFEFSDTALWQAHEQITRTRPPKLDPRAVGREHLEGGVRTVIAIVPGGEGYYRLAPNEWAILQLFDGERSMAEVAELHTQNTGVLCTEDYIRTVADAVEPTNLLYKAPHEKSRALMDELLRHRRKVRRKNFNLTDINLANWNSDAYFEWVYPKLRFIYTRWFTALTLRRGPQATIVRATSSFPVPLSPRITTVVRLSATRRIAPNTRRMGSLPPTMSQNMWRSAASPTAELGGTGRGRINRTPSWRMRMTRFAKPRRSKTNGGPVNY